MTSLRQRLAKLESRSKGLRVDRCPACGTPTRGGSGARVIYVDENGVERRGGFRLGGGGEPRFCLECGKTVSDDQQGPHCSLPGQWPDVGEGPIFRVMARVPGR